MSADYVLEELLIAAIAGLLEGCGHIAVGVSSPIPGSAALLRRHRDLEAGRRTRVSIIGTTIPAYRTDGGVDLFDSAGQGRVDAFFLSGGQIDGRANINLVGVGGGYPQQKVRWSGSFGSAYLYFMVPKVILFRLEHSRRTMVEAVDFISAPGASPPNVHRPGGPFALVTDLCLFRFDRERARFSLASVHPGHMLEEVRDNTGFDFDIPETVPETEPPDAETLSILRRTVAPDIADPYPKFARRVWGVSAAA